VSLPTRRLGEGVAPRIHRFSFMRGLDGGDSLMPHRGQPRSRAKPEADGRVVQRSRQSALRQQPVDYLRRLAAHLRRN